ncbi:hypothetical protein [Aquimarina aquimarini]|uniref:hypothetical protein n=1 Tax=Aquimarina aquimarini TaxID=1191734 RepID=UPI000D553A38|nr:hypothetical protein [Aquimarina aquimarini]
MKKIALTLTLSILFFACKKDDSVPEQPKLDYEPWEIIKNFDNGKIGEKAESHPDAFDGAAGHSLYDNEFTYKGTGAAKLHIKKGQEGFGLWGGILNFPEKIKNGQHLYLSMAIRIPSEFIIATPGNGSLKFLRFASETAEGKSNGYIDLQIVDDQKQSLPIEESKGQFRMLREHQAKWFYYGTPGLLTKDEWHKIDVYVKFDKTLASEGGTSKIIWWYDGQKIHEEKAINTILHDGDYFHSFYLFTYWNGLAPQDQHLWVDEIKMSTGHPDWALETIN